MEETQKKRDYFLPVSILIAALLISISVIYSAGKQPTTTPPEGNDVAQAALYDKLRPVGKDDHVLGEANAALTIFEFSDLECPFCKRFHATMQRIMEEYKGKVRWVYRHFPLDVLHSKARKEAEATECVAELGGNTAFWKFTDRIYAITPANNGLDLAQLPALAAGAGVDQKAFETCLASGRHGARVQTDVLEAMSVGGEGTPYSLIVAKNGKKYPINGALPYEQIKLLLDDLLSK